MDNREGRESQLTINCNFYNASAAVALVWTKTILQIVSILGTINDAARQLIC